MQTLSNKAERDYIRFARSLGKLIGAHHKMIGDSSYSVEEYQRIQAESDAAVATVKYIVQSVENRHIAVIVATFSGCRSFINWR